MSHIRCHIVLFFSCYSPEHLPEKGRSAWQMKRRGSHIILCFKHLYHFSLIPWTLGQAHLLPNISQIKAFCKTYCAISQKSCEMTWTCNTWTKVCLRRMGSSAGSSVSARSSRSTGSPTRTAFSSVRRKFWSVNLMTFKPFLASRLRIQRLACKIEIAWPLVKHLSHIYSLVWFQECLNSLMVYFGKYPLISRWLRNQFFFTLSLYTLIDLKFCEHTFIISF